MSLRIVDSLAPLLPMGLSCGYRVPKYRELLLPQKLEGGTC